MPTMLPRHFRIVSRVFARFGYKTEPLEIGLHGDSRPVIDAGLKYVHNDACYPAILIVGQFIAALESGQYDPHKVALLLTQTGGGCRASNYIALLRKALIRAGYAYVPVISLNTVGLEQMPGFKITLPLLHKGLYAILYTYSSFADYNLNMWQLNEFDLWLADYRNKRPTRKHGMWQYSSKGNVAGVSGVVDMNHVYKDYPGIIAKAGLTCVKGA